MMCIKKQDKMPYKCREYQSCVRSLDIADLIPELQKD